MADTHRNLKILVLISALIGGGLQAFAQVEILVSTKLTINGEMHIVTAGAAPDEIGGGAVYLTNSGVTTLISQRLQAPDERLPANFTATRFGSDLDFIGDINGDDHEDLVISADGGIVVVYLSSYSSANLRYIDCGFYYNSAHADGKVQVSREDYASRGFNLTLSDSSGLVSDNLMVFSQVGECSFDRVPLREEYHYGQTPSELVISPTPTAHPTVALDHGDDLVGGVATAPIIDEIALKEALTPIPQVVPTPVEVSPDQRGLPAPQVVKSTGREGDVQIVMPEVVPIISEFQKRAVLKKLIRNRRVSKHYRQQLLDDPKNMIVTYILHYARLETHGGISFINSAHAVERSKRPTGRINQIRSRNRTVTISRLSPGKTYVAWYQVEISIAKPRLVLGVTKPSATVRFRS